MITVDYSINSNSTSFANSMMLEEESYTECVSNNNPIIVL